LDSNIQLGGSGANRTVSILPNGVTTGTATITLTVNDGTGQKASTSFDLTITGNLALANTQRIQINDRSPADLYPSVINVNRVDGLVSGVTVTLVGFTHPFPDDVDVLLVSPDNRKVMLMSDAGGGTAASGLRLQFSGSAATAIPDDGALSNGTFRPANYTDATEGDEAALPSPAPAGPYSADLSALAGASPNGDWKLFVRDDTFPDGGAIEGGWILILQTAPIISSIGPQTTLEDTPISVP